MQVHLYVDIFSINNTAVLYYLRLFEPVNADPWHREDHCKEILGFSTVWALAPLTLELFKVHLHWGLNMGPLIVHLYMSFPSWLSGKEHLR